MNFERKKIKTLGELEKEAVDDKIRIRTAEKDERIIGAEKKDEDITVNNKVESSSLSDKEKQRLIKNAQIAKLKFLKSNLKLYQDNSFCRLMSQQERATKMEEISKKIKELESNEQIDSVEQIEKTRRSR